MTEIVLEKEGLIFELIQEYLAKKRTFNAKEIMPYLNNRISKSKTNLNEKGIKLILQNLIEKNIIIEGSRITKKDVLSNVNRRKIFEFIKENPGTYLNKIVKKLNYNINLVSWHVKTLLKFECINTSKIENHEVYYITEINPNLVRKIHFISKEKCKIIIEYFKKHRKIKRKSDLYNNLDMHHNTIKKYLELLEEFNIIIKTNGKGEPLYTFNEETYQKLQSYLKK
ncbi:MAG: hypothetical protein ACFFAO_03165 [Candidatus Hermodarchaeota archaeon]